VIHEILLSVVADRADEAHESVVQMAESRGSSVLEVVEEKISTEDGDEIDGFCIQARLTAGKTT
jgi:hypothetical protein